MYHVDDYSTYPLYRWWSPFLGLQRTVVIPRPCHIQPPTALHWQRHFSALLLHTITLIPLSNYTWVKMVQSWPSLHRGSIAPSSYVNWKGFWPSPWRSLGTWHLSPRDCAPDAPITNLWVSASCQTKGEWPLLVIGWLEYACSHMWGWVQACGNNHNWMTHDGGEIRCVPKYVVSSQ